MLIITSRITFLLTLLDSLKSYTKAASRLYSISNSISFSLRQRFSNIFISNMRLEVILVLLKNIIYLGLKYYLKAAKLLSALGCCFSATFSF